MHINIVCGNIHNTRIDRELNLSFADEEELSKFVKLTELLKWAKDNGSQKVTLEITL